MINKKLKKEIMIELKEHVPFTAIASFLAVLLTIILINFFKEPFLLVSANLFEIFHPLHVIFSAFVTTAIYYKYKKSKIQAILIGITGAILIGTLSDVILPYFEASFLGIPTILHLPIIQEPLMIITSALIGSVFGLMMLQTHASHFMHVLLSVFASLFYILAYSSELTILYLLATIIIVFIAVIIPCCLSDIVYPVLFIKKR